MKRHYLKEIWFEDEELIGHFVAWFLDGGGEQSFTMIPPEDCDGRTMIADYYKEDKTWGITWRKD